jgi:hypothetical protein
MQTGMLPPKLAQMMINIASSNLEIPSPLGRGLGRGIFDPFV